MCSLSSIVFVWQSSSGNKLKHKIDVGIGRVCFILFLILLLHHKNHTYPTGFWPANFPLKEQNRTQLDCAIFKERKKMMRRVKNPLCLQTVFSLSCILSTKAAGGKKMCDWTSHIIWPWTLEIREHFAMRIHSRKPPQYEAFFSWIYFHL